MTYGSSEGAGVVACRGDEWLDHPGTLGKGWGGTLVRILDAAGRDVPSGEVGEIYMKPPRRHHALLPRGGPGDASTDDGYTTIGDLGWVDDEGYLFVADRRVDMIVTGGANVFPAEVEAALSEHPGIADVVVIGLQDRNGDAGCTPSCSRPILPGAGHRGRDHRLRQGPARRRTRCPRRSSWWSRSRGTT